MHGSAYRLFGWYSWDQSSISILFNQNFSFWLICYAAGENIGGLHFVPTFVISEIEMTSLLLREHPVCKWESVYDSHSLCLFVSVCICVRRIFFGGGLGMSLVQPTTTEHTSGHQAGKYWPGHQAVVILLKKWSLYCCLEKICICTIFTFQYKFVVRFISSLLE